MKNKELHKTDASMTSCAAFDTQIKLSKSKLGATLSPTHVRSQSNKFVTRSEEVDTKNWNLAEKLGRDYDRTLIHQRARSPNFILNHSGNFNLVDPKADDAKLKVKFDKY